MDWDKLRTFYVVAKAGTLTKAAKSLSIGQSSVSRQISSLEENLGVVLFNRHSRGLVLTEQGDILYKTVHDIFIKLSSAQETLKDSKGAIAGSLTVAVCPFLLETWLAPRLQAFIQKYPHIHLKLKVVEGDIDLHMREADVAIQMQESSNGNLIQKHLTTFDLGIYASKKYIEKNGYPKTREELKSHSIIACEENSFFSSVKANWFFTNSTKNEKQTLFPHISVNSFLGVYQMIKNNVGIGVLPSYTTDKDLQTILGSMPCPLVSIFFLYPTELRSSKKAKVFQNFLVEEFHKT